MIGYKSEWNVDVYIFLAIFIIIFYKIITLLGNFYFAPNIQPEGVA